MKSDNDYLNRCVRLARKGASYVSPNPLVAAIIVSNNKIIAEGYHHKYGDIHAEVDALSKLKKIPNDAVLYCNLEPCSHNDENKINPPCTKAIFDSGIKKVVIGMIDPNPLVSGNGVTELKSKNIEVIVLNHLKSQELNRHFSYHISKKLPYVKLKIAQSLDAKITDAYNQSKWISSEESRKQVHKDRSLFDAVLSTARTVNKDDAELTVRLIKGRNPKRIILDKHAELNFDSKLSMTSQAIETILITGSNIDTKYIENAKKKACKILSMPGNNGENFNLKELLKEIYSLKIASLYVEAGQSLSSQFIEENLVQEIEFHLAPILLGQGLNSLDFKQMIALNNAIRLRKTEVKKNKNDIIIRGFLDV
jgi:diaminohydroxyphosphoribosylaminopyrimidine deaminase/5-amino-6-(5-phosphoribosylamino)uracil reductase